MPSPSASSEAFRAMMFEIPQNTAASRDSRNAPNGTWVVVGWFPITPLMKNQSTSSNTSPTT